MSNFKIISSFKINAQSLVLKPALQLQSAWEKHMEFNLDARFGIMKLTFFNMDDFL